MSYFRLLVFILGVLPAIAADFYVSPTGTPQGNGSGAAPWNLATALNATSQVHPGDRIWIRGGTYKGTFISSMGSAAAPIVVRNYRDERVILDGSLAGQAVRNVPVLTVYSGGYTWFWGLKITNSDPHGLF